MAAKKGKKARRRFASPSHGKAASGASSSAAETANLFEQLWARKKFDVLGKKVKGASSAFGPSGNPKGGILHASLGKARSQAVARRRATLLPEYSNRGKANDFVDRRFGEDDDDVPESEKAVVRFQRERQAQLSRKRRFSLADEDEEDEDYETQGGIPGDGGLLGSIRASSSLGVEERLTHGGRSLDELDDFDDVDLGLGDEDDDRDGQLNRDMVEALHFGGGLFTQKPTSSAAPTAGVPGQEPPKTRKEIMEEVIAKSKFYKAEKQKQKLEDEGLLSKLDEDFKGLVQAVQFQALSAKQLRPKHDENTQKEDFTKAFDDDMEYEKLAKEMIFDLKAKPGERSKTAEEQAEAERARLEKLEKERKQRMSGEGESDEEVSEAEVGENAGAQGKKKMKELSGDDLGENFVIEGEEEAGGEGKGWVYDVLARKERDESGNEEQVDEDGEEGEKEEETEEEEVDEAEEEERDDDEGEEEEDDEEREESDPRRRLFDAFAEESEEGGSGEESGEEETEQGEGEHKEAEEGERNKEERGQQQQPQEQGASVEVGREKMLSAKFDADEAGKAEPNLKKLAKTKTNARAVEFPELPFVIDAPQDLQSFCSLVDGRPVSDLSLAIRRIRVCNAPNLAPDNKRKMQVFYNVLLQYFSRVAKGDLPCATPFDMERVDALVQPLVELSGAHPLFAAVCARERLRRMHRQLVVKLRGAAASVSSVMPDRRTLLLLRLWTIIFPCSDFRHPVSTPLALLCTQFLSCCPLQTPRDAAVALFLCTLLYTMMLESQRFVPEVVAMLHALLLSALPPKLLQQRPQLAEGLGRHMLDGVCHQPWLWLPGAPTSRADSRKCSRKAILLEPLSRTKDKDKLSLSSVLSLEESDPYFASSDFRGSATLTLLKVLRQFANCYKGFLPFPEMFRPFLLALEALGDELKIQGTNGAVMVFHRELDASRREVMEDILSAAKSCEGTRQPMRIRVQPPKAIKQYNPKFEEEGFVLGRDYDPDRARAEKRRLQRQLKKEKRGAMRELRKDNSFLASEKAKEKSAALEERREKSKKAWAFLEQQEHAYKSGQLGGRKRRGKKR